MTTITEVRASTLHTVRDPQFVWRRGMPGSGEISEVTVLSLHTDDGHVGYGTVSRGVIGQDLIERRFKDIALGADPLLKERLWHEVWEVDRVEEIPLYAHGVLDIALWDLTAKLAGRPLYELLGGAQRRVTAYASTATYPSIEAYLDVADQCLDLGFRDIKIHAWGDVREDAALAHALRSHVGDDIRLTYDASGGFTLDESRVLGRELHAAGFAVFEEPMREFNLWRYRRLREDLEIPVLAGETSDGIHWNIADFITSGAADIVRTSTFYKGGITGALRVSHLADAFGLNAEIHAAGLPNLHLACAVSNHMGYEIVVAEDPVKLLHPLSGPGYVEPPDVPGIGFPYTPEQLEADAVDHRVWTLD
ncbi:enolase C-terminal domain-like protein [Egicoccus halophilus]|uniref:Mandelate racemase n=1 Tax=Egicoccus halophilus TaxID=1670830 RepID=A0A8J3EUZ9_9ACTN|nr:enolase C-terminal domain-like protein [Egicoccus halophilus]GGI08685.1 mandelate racemase [Egicoccus halophilus]